MTKPAGLNYGRTKLAVLELGVPELGVREGMSLDQTVSFPKHIFYFIFKIVPTVTIVVVDHHPGS
jgi:hypothetical protein